MADIGRLLGPYLALGCAKVDDTEVQHEATGESKSVMENT